MTALLSAIEAALADAPDADEGLRATVRLLAAEPAIAWAGVAFEEDGALVLGPTAGTADDARRTRIPVLYRGEQVGELWVDGAADAELLEAVSARLGEHVLLGWDTGGEAWEP